MNCKDVEYKIISGEPLDADESLHLLECSSCQKFADIHNHIIGIREPSEKTDNAILTAFRDSARRRRKVTFRRYVGAAAACAVLLVILSLAHFKQRNLQEPLSLTADEQWLIGYSLENDDICDMELSISQMELPLVASNGNSNLKVGAGSVSALGYDRLALEMDMDVH